MYVEVRRVVRFVEALPREEVFYHAVWEWAEGGLHVSKQSQWEEPDDPTVGHDDELIVAQELKYRLCVNLLWLAGIPLLWSAAWVAWRLRPTRRAAPAAN